jgi:poly(A) polymerase
MIFQIQAHERAILLTISDAARELDVAAYIVGGYVRDRLLARPSKDMDIVCLGAGIELAEAVADRLLPRPKVVTYPRFGTAMLRHRDMEIEFVGARKESYRADSRKPAVENGTLEDDQNRRDFTINALAVSLHGDTFGEIVDPFNGLRHLEQKILQTPCEAGKTFSDDPLRMMRGIRFAAQLGFTIEKTTLAAISEHRERIRIVSKERIIVELEKILATAVPSVGLLLLYQTGLLKIIFPELVALQGAETREGVGHKDNFFHTLQVVDNISRHTQNQFLRWAAVMHDIGKPATKRFDSEDNGWTFHGHPEVGANMLPKIFRHLGLPTDERLKYVQKLVRMHHRPVAVTKEEITDSAIRRLLFDAGEDFDDLMLLCEADITSKQPHRVRRYLENYELVRQRCVVLEEKDRLRNWQPPISGELIMSTFGITPSREVGMIKNAIREAILDGEIENEYEPAFAFMLSQGEQLGLKVAQAHHKVI